MATDIRALDEIRQRLETAENAGDAGVLTELLAADAVLMVPDYPVQVGRHACTTFVHDVLGWLHDRFHRAIQYVSDEILVMGDYALDRGTFSFTVAPRSGGDRMRAQGKYLWVYSRAADRSWRISRAMMSLDEQQFLQPMELESSQSVH